MGVPCPFQFLIGRLDTNSIGPGCPASGGFQFLIGRLDTCPGKTRFNFAGRVSIPHR